MPEQIIQLDSRRLPTRVFMFLITALVTVGLFYSGRWYLGNTIAETFNQDQGSPDTVKLAVDLAPNDPLTHWRLGDFTERKLPPDRIGDAVGEYERAVSLSPSDYRLWMTLGRALEHAGDTDRAEKALSRAVQLAPSYAFPRWYLGNLLIRSGRFDEGFVELQRASEANPELRPQLFNLAWEVYKEDTTALGKSVGRSAEARAQVALYLMGRGRYEDGLKIWGSLTEHEKRENRLTAQGIIGSLAGTNQFHKAVSVWNDVAPGPNYNATMGQFMDGSFDSGITYGSNAIFSWQVQSQSQMQIAIDPSQGNTGPRSLRLTFQVREKLDSINLTQLVPVQPNTEYDFECYFKTFQLESAGTPFITISDAADRAEFAKSPPVPAGSNSWQKLNLSFKTGEKTEAIVLRVNRAQCGEDPVCPIFGSVWYDDFTLKPRG